MLTASRVSAFLVTVVIVATIVIKVVSTFEQSSECSITRLNDYLTSPRVFSKVA